MEALSSAFGSDDVRKHVVVANLKALTGHPMGVGFEDVVAVEVKESVC